MAGDKIDLSEVTLRVDVVGAGSNGGARTWSALLLLEAIESRLVLLGDLGDLAVVVRRHHELAVMIVVLSGDLVGNSTVLLPLQALEDRGLARSVELVGLRERKVWWRGLGFTIGL